MPTKNFVKGTSLPEIYIPKMISQSEWQVIDTEEQKEVCLCNNYDGSEDAEDRAKVIAFALNISMKLARENK